MNDRGLSTGGKSKLKDGVQLSGDDYETEEKSKIIKSEKGAKPDQCQLIKFEKFFLIHNICTIIWYFFILMKNALFILMKFNMLLEYRHISCILIGRVRFYGIDDDFLLFFISFIGSFRASWSLCAVLSNHRDYYFDWLEFLFKQEHQSRRNNGTSVNPPLPIDTGQDRALLDPRVKIDGNIATKKKKSKSTNQMRVHSVGRNDIDPSRPNRDIDALRNLTDRALTYSWCVIASLIMFMITLLILAVPLLITRQGLNRGYSHCISYLTSNATDIDELFFGSIYRSLYQVDSATKEVADRQPSPEGQTMADQSKPKDPFKLVEFNYFQVARILFELMESIFVIHDMLLTILSPVILLMLITDDVLYYSEDLLQRMRSKISDFWIINTAINKEISAGYVKVYKRLDRMYGIHFARGWDQQSVSGRLKEHMRAENHSALNLRSSLRSHNLDSSLSKEERDDKTGIHDGTYRTQLMIGDLFVLIESYNPFSATIVKRYVFAWAIYSIFVASWMFTPRDILDSKVECYFLHVLATVVTALIIIKSAMVRRASLQLYKLIVRRMAIEDDSRENKLRWAKLIGLYYPIPMHCFRLFQTMELSLFFGFRLISWIFSALFLSLTFYNYFI